MAKVMNPTFDLSTPEKIADFIRRNETAHPNAKKPVEEIQTSDIIYLDYHPCKMFDPPMISHLQSRLENGRVVEIEEGLIVVRGVSVIDGNEYDQMYSAGGDAQYFVDDHVEREWLVTGREGMRVFLQAPGDPSNKWTLWMQPEKVIPCFWLLARNFPGKVYFKVYSAMGLNLCTGARDAPGFTS